jgi:hypothetical protein
MSNTPETYRLRNGVYLDGHWLTSLLPLEGINCVEKIAEYIHLDPIRRMYQVVRMLLLNCVCWTENKLEKRIRIKIGKFRSLHQEKQRLLEHQMVLCKFFDAKYGEWLDVTWLCWSYRYDRWGNCSTKLQDTRS